MLALLLCACSRVPAERVEPTFLEVTLGDVATGSAEAPLPFTSAATAVPITVQALDRDGAPYALDADVSVRARPARLDSDSRVSLTDGAWTGTVQFHSGFGPTRIWVLDDLPSDDRPTPSYHGGASDPLWFTDPTVAQLQFTDDHETNQLDGEFARLTVADRQVVVTATDSAGFWVADLDDGTAAYNTLYVYTFNKPDDEIVVGARIHELTGIDQEYLASTQFSHPTISVAEGETLVPPEALVLDEGVACDDDQMEAREGAKVVAEAPTIPSTFTADSEDYADYLEYGQWPLQVGACTIYAESGSTAPDFHPTDHAGETLGRVTGMLKEIYGKWILVVLDAGDIVTSAGPPRPAIRRTPRPTESHR